MKHPLCLAGTVLALLASPATATTWIVDDDGGPGVDFLSISAAVAAAVPGDTIVVRAGSYAGFAVDEGLSILGSSGALVAGTVEVHDVPSGPRVALTSLEMRRLRVRDCTAVVILDALRLTASTFEGQTAYLDVARCPDVRLRRSQVWPGYGEPWNVGVRVTDARLEITESDLLGSSGYSFSGGIPGDDGSTALVCSVGSDVHVSCTTVRGGNGGPGDIDPVNPGGDGAPAIHVAAPTARLLLTGRASDLIRGGAGAYGYPTGTPSPALVVGEGFARVSGVTFAAWGPPPIVTTGGTLEQPAIADPCLALPTATPPGQSVTFTLHGTPGAAARLRVGRQATVVDLLGVDEDRLTLPLRTYDLGTMPASGSATFVFHVPASLPDGFLAIFQGSVVDASGTRLTQSVPVVIH